MNQNSFLQRKTQSTNSINNPIEEANLEKIKEQEKNINNEESTETENESINIKNSEKPKISKKNLEHFDSNINIKYLRELCNNSENIGYNDLIEVYNLKNDLSSAFVAIKNNESQLVDIYEMTSIENAKKIVSLKGHFDKLTGVRYFLDIYRGKEYLLTLDRGNTVIIWEIKDKLNYIKIRKLESDCQPGKNIIYSCLIFFTKDNKYILTTKFCFGKVYSRLLKFDTGKLIYGLKFTERNKTRHIIEWKDVINNKLYVIECCFNCKVIIYNPLEQKIYDEIEINGDNICACIVKAPDKKSDYLCINSCVEETSIVIYNLQEKNIIDTIKIKSMLYQMVSWNDRYLLVADKTNRSFDIFDIYQKKIIFIAKGRHNKAVKCAKKIKLNDNELILTCGIDSRVQLWLNNNKSIKIKKPY